MFSGDDLTLEAAKKCEREDKLKDFEKSLISQKMKMERAFVFHRS